jgi:hypothetical protein
VVVQITPGVRQVLAPMKGIKKIDKYIKVRKCFLVGVPHDTQLMFLSDTLRSSTESLLDVVELQQPSLGPYRQTRSHRRTRRRFGLHQHRKDKSRR